ncbi:MAG: carboxyl transferase domain-containing protein [Candidatus Binatus sp.]|uniref:carboxyl transferase domain-containing protein n=1 Tax=Candidatus Binatus sp. TaxID=2811406 RepID=UPI00271807FA|nr:carboxyl transferase domain-containing protein [Candidatus Binatus sp.]MDO8433060.1 carboxyl transferase domain-containing protein [Candidatus Binatus sp.]
MLPSSLLVANRGEIAIRVMRAAAEMGIRTVAVFSEDDAQSLHTRKADEARGLGGTGARAYLDAEQMIAVAKDTGCDALHPGYGFLSENANFARRCAEEGITFVGPRAEILELFGDKMQARALAERCGVPLLSGTSSATSVEHAAEFFAALGEGGAMMIKAVTGGGGRGMRAVYRAEEIEEAYKRCQSEARAAFGNSDVYVEQMMPRARHIEVQIIGDHAGEVSHLWERECSIQRRNQKVVEIAPSPGLPGALRDRLTSAAVKLAKEVRYDNLGTFEFLVDASAGEGEPVFAFIEANPRLQVEHTVTEAVTGIDLVKVQLQLAAGRSLAELGLLQAEIPAPRGYAIQARINMESMAADGSAKPSGGTISAFETPSGPGLRIDTFAYSGYTTNPNFDSLLGKLIAHSTSRDYGEAVAKAYRALSEFKIEGVATNIGFLQSLLRHPEFAANRVHTRFIESNIAELVGDAQGNHRRMYFEQPAAARPAGGRRAGAKIDSSDPLAVLTHGKSSVDESAVAREVETIAPARSYEGAAENTVAVEAPMQGTIVSIDVAEGDVVHRGQQLAVMEAMKMEHVINAHVSGIVRGVAVAKGDAIFEGHPIVFIEEADVGERAEAVRAEVDLDRIRPDLQEVIERHALGFDAARPDAVGRRRKTGQRTARENIEDLCDPGTFIEYGPVVIAAQRRRRALDDLIKRTPADGMIAGIGSVNGDVFEPSRSRCILMSYDYTVLAGTQGQQNHRKKDRMFEIAERSRLPIVFFTEGGGGRPGDTDGIGVAGLDCMAFNFFGKLSALVPLIGITSGRCFAGNAALLGCCDVVIATKGSNIGMGGPAMIEGGGLGIFRPEEVGPMDVQVPNGVVDIPVADEEEAVLVAKKYISYFQGEVANWECADQRLLRGIIPENRLRIYDVRTVIETLADKDSVLEIRRHFGPGMVTALARIEGRPIGIIANNPAHLAGAIVSDGADKAARFMQLCDAFDIPMLFLCDTPGIMVGPEVEKTALVRHAARMFVTGSNVTVPFFTIILRKGYGLGAQAMAGGSFKAPIFTVSWPTGEFGGMGLEGAVKLGYRNELIAEQDPAARKKLFDEMVERMYQHGKAVNTASHFEIDDVIDPLESRKWIMAGLRSAPPPEIRTGKKRPYIDTW